MPHWTSDATQGPKIRNALAFCLVARFEAMSSQIRAPGRYANRTSESIAVGWTKKAINNNYTCCYVTGSITTMFWSSENDTDDCISISRMRVLCGQETLRKSDFKVFPKKNRFLGHGLCLATNDLDDMTKNKHF